MKIFTAEEIGHLPTNKIYKMLLLTPHEHTFWYIRPDRTLYLYHHRKKMNPPKFFTELFEPHQLELF